MKADHPHPGRVVLQLDIVLGRRYRGLVVLFQGANQVIVPDIGIFHRVIALVGLTKGIVEMPENRKGQTIIILLEELFSLSELRLRVVVITGLLGKGRRTQEEHKNR
jgi:hypothetical protein